MKESNIQTLFGNWLKENPKPSCSVYELKLCKNKSLPFSSVKPHQVSALLSVRRGGLYYKITDTAAINHFTAPKPFDCFFLNNANAYIAVCFYVPRKPKILYMIDVDDWVKERDTSTRKSLTEKRAKELSIMMVTL